MADHQLLLFDDLQPVGGSRAGHWAPTTCDEPIDAIVYDVHPAMSSAEQSFDADYPYGPPARVAPANHEPLAVAEAVRSMIDAADRYLATIQRPPDYVVPKTFGMSAILGIMTALALLFAGLRRLNAPPELYFFLSGLAIAICIAQMAYGGAPRLASVVAGALILPLVMVISVALSGDWRRTVFCIFLAVPLIPCGALLGYLTGTCAAGIFLVMNYLEPYLQGQAISHSKPTT
jgi:hypothetical protein